MNNLFSKSSKRLLEKSSIPLENTLGMLKQLLTEQRMQRSDLKDISGKLDRLLIDKHLQQQVDTYFDDTPELEDK